eukprot:comp5907_c0_seq1/m.1766 comp5907_c0_seq1/g.1766  ORF comp5907_c0_seq1/g.1766 comp5907_c0_seq1/m.1766 type:complete len:578 (-) comp5907_c0_seq1:528-2261(-)
MAEREEVPSVPTGRTGVERYGEESSYADPLMPTITEDPSVQRTSSYGTETIPQSSETAPGGYVGETAAGPYGAGGASPTGRATSAGPVVGQAMAVMQASEGEEYVPEGQETTWTEDLTIPKYDIWDPDQFKYLVRHMENTAELVDKHHKMLTERAEIERSYSGRLDSWARKWEKAWREDIHGADFGFAKRAYVLAAREGRKAAKLHYSAYQDVTEEVKSLVEWRDHRFTKKLQLTGYKYVPRELAKVEQLLDIAQAPWSKLLNRYQKQQKAYHDRISALQKARDVLAEAERKGDVDHTTLGKLRDRVRSAEDEMEKDKAEYMRVLADVDEHKPKYIDDIQQALKTTQEIQESYVEHAHTVLLHYLDYVSMASQRNITELQETYNLVQSHLNKWTPEQDLNEYGLVFSTDPTRHDWPSYREWEAQEEADARPIATEKAPPAPTSGPGVLGTSAYGPAPVPYATTTPGPATGEAIATGTYHGAPESGGVSTGVPVHVVGYQTVPVVAPIPQGAEISSCGMSGGPFGGVSEEPAGLLGQGEDVLTKQERQAMAPGAEFNPQTTTMDPTTTAGADEPPHMV